jgi:RNA polymerase sigma-70 factor (ECF subfamily)
MTPNVTDIAPGDEQLAEAISRRDAYDGAWKLAQDAFAEIYLRYARPLAAFLAARAGRGQVDDALQEVWRRVWQHLPRSFHGGNFRAWLYQIARNYLTDLGRKAQPTALPQECNMAAPRSLEAAEALIDQEHRAIFQRCLEQLATTAADLVKARLGGKGYPEICRRLNLTPNQAHKLFHQAKAQLQACVEGGTA